MTWNPQDPTQELMQTEYAIPASLPPAGLAVTEDAPMAAPGILGAPLPQAALEEFFLQLERNGTDKEVVEDMKKKVMSLMTPPRPQPLPPPSSPPLNLISSCIPPLPGNSDSNMAAPSQPISYESPPDQIEQSYGPCDESAIAQIKRNRGTSGPFPTSTGSPTKVELKKQNANLHDENEALQQAVLDVTAKSKELHEQEREMFKAAANTVIFEQEEAEKVKLAKMQVMLDRQKNAELKQLRLDMMNNTQRQIAQLQQKSEAEKRQLEALSQAKLNEMKQAAEMEKQRLIDLAKQEITMTANLKDQQTALIHQSKIELELTSNQDKETIAAMERQMQKNAEIMRTTMQIEFNTKTAEMRQVNEAQHIEFQRVQAENQQAQSKMNTLVFELQAQLTAQAAQNQQLQLGPSQAT